MLLLFKLGLLVSLVRMSVLYDPLGDRPLFLATIYTLGSALVNGTMMAKPYPYRPLWILPRLGVSWLYFWLLNRMVTAHLGRKAGQAISTP